MNIVLALLFALFSASAAAAPVPAPPEVEASGYLLMEMHSGRVLAEKNADERLEPASLTKIMTALVVFEELAQGTLGLDDPVTVSEKAWKTEGSRMFIEVNSRVPVGELLKGLIVQSGNDAAVALAEHIAGSEAAFANLMNEHARQLGLENTHFVNATGLPHPDHYTTPRDIARVTAAVISRHPEFYRLYSMKEYTYNGIRQHNRNRLLWRDPSVDGVKTGHTRSAGYCLVASARRDGMRLISVVMGTDSDKTRVSASQALLNHGFRFYETHRLHAAGSPVTQARVWMGERETVPVGPSADLYVTIPRRRHDDLRQTPLLEEDIEAPVAAGQALGTLEVRLEDEVIARVPLIALETVDEGGWWRRLIDRARRWWEKG